MINFTPSVAEDGAQPNRSSVRVDPGLTDGSNTAADEHAVVGRERRDSVNHGSLLSDSVAPASPKENA